MNTNTLTAMLRNVEFLNGMAPEHLEQIASNAEVRDYGKSETVFREGEPAESTYLVVSGKFALELSPATIYSKHLVDVFPGEMLGWSALVGRQPFAATAIAVEPSRVIRIDGASLRALCESDPKFGCEFMRRTVLVLGERLKKTWTQLTHLYVSHYLPLGASSEADE